MFNHKNGLPLLRRMLQSSQDLHAVLLIEPSKRFVQ
jgi:hypothetical protein